MGVIIESHLTTNPAYVLVRSEKYPALYKAVLVDKASPVQRVKQHVDAAFDSIVKQEAKFSELGELFPEYVAEGPDDVPSELPSVVPEPTEQQKALHKKWGRK